MDLDHNAAAQSRHPYHSMAGVAESTGPPRGPFLGQPPPQRGQVYLDQARRCRYLGRR